MALMSGKGRLQNRSDHLVESNRFPKQEYSIPPPQRLPVPLGPIAFKILTNICKFNIL